MIIFHLRVLWHFAFNNIKSMVRSTDRSFESSHDDNSSPNLFLITGRVPRVVSWLWLNLSIFTISNQNLLGSVIGDSINKPWRPIPSKKIFLANARRLLLAVIIPLVFFITFYLGAVEVSVALMVFTRNHNDLGGAENNFFVRSILNSVGFVSYSLVATLIASDSKQFSLNVTAHQCLQWSTR